MLSAKSRILTVEIGAKDEGSGGRANSEQWLRIRTCALAMTCAWTDNGCTEATNRSAGQAAGFCLRACGGNACVWV